MCTSTHQSYYSSHHLCLGQVYSFYQDDPSHPAPKSCPVVFGLLQMIEGQYLAILFWLDQPTPPLQTDRLYSTTSSFLYLSSWSSSHPFLALPSHVKTSQNFTYFPFFWGGGGCFLNVGGSRSAFFSLSDIPTNTMLLASRHSSGIPLLVHEIDQITHVGATVELDSFLFVEEGGLVWAVAGTAHLAHY